MAKCLNCNIEFTPKRKTAMYCSDPCRQENHKKLKEQNVIQVPKSNPVSFMGFGSPGSNSISGNPAVDFLLTKVQHENLALQNANETLKNANETLKDKLMELKLELATKDKLSEAEKISEQSKGLGGVIDKLSSNDRIMDLIENLGLAAIGAKKGDPEEGDSSLDLGENKELVMETINLIKDKDQTFIALHYKVTQFYAKHPELLSKAVAAIKQVKQQVETNPNE